MKTPRQLTREYRQLPDTNLDKLIWLQDNLEAVMDQLDTLVDSERIILRQRDSERVRANTAEEKARKLSEAMLMAGKIMGVVQ